MTSPLRINEINTQIEQRYEAEEEEEEKNFLQRDDVMFVKNKLGEPLPLLEKGMYENETPNKKIIFQKAFQDKLKSFKYKLDHECSQINQNDMRCKICYGSVESIVLTKSSSQVLYSPYEICGIDFLQIFIKKMEVLSRDNGHRFKRFLIRSYLHQLRQIAFFQLMRRQPHSYFGMEELLANSKCRPACLEGYETRTKPSDFEKIFVFGDYENSNISSASIDVANTQLMILLRSDSNTKGCLHWFSFIVLAKQQCNIRFSILNNKKNGLFFKEGMKIAILQIDDEQEETHPQFVDKWKRGGEAIFYSKSNIDHAFYKTESQEKNSQSTQATEGRGFQTLDFNYKFEKPGQRVVFAYCYPYTFTDLCSFLKNMENNLKELEIQQQSKEKKLLKQGTMYESNDLNLHLNYGNSPQKESKERQQAEESINFCKILTKDAKYKRQLLGHSRLGLPIYQLKIGASKRTGPFKKKKRKVIYIIARQHPGESPSSFVCQGMIEFLISDHPRSKFLRSVYIFKIVPMINPDGVSLGNSRCNMSGFDLNRQWHSPNKKLSPEVYCVKEEIIRTQKKREVVIFCDLHGHSQQMGFFIYGCDKIDPEEGTSSWTSARLLSHILAKRSQFFELSQCKYKVQKEKMSTARVTAYEELKIPFSFTVETSFYGYNKIKDCNRQSKSFQRSESNSQGNLFQSGDKRNVECVHFSIQDMFEIGQTICLGFLEQIFTLEKLQHESKQLKGKLEANQTDKQQEAKKQLGNQHPIFSSFELNAICPDIYENWRDYFNQNELQKNFRMIESGEDPNELESEDGGSDSEPEEDLFKPNEWPFSMHETKQDEEDGEINLLRSKGLANQKSLKKDDRRKKEFSNKKSPQGSQLPKKIGIDSFWSSQPNNNLSLNHRNSLKSQSVNSVSKQVFKNQNEPYLPPPHAERSVSVTQVTYKLPNSINELKFFQKNKLNGNLNATSYPDQVEIFSTKKSASANNSLNSSFVKQPTIKKPRLIRNCEELRKKYQNLQKNQNLLKQKQLEFLVLSSQDHCPMIRKNSERKKQFSEAFANKIENILSPRNSLSNSRVMLNKEWQNLKIILNQKLKTKLDQSINQDKNTQIMEESNNLSRNTQQNSESQNQVSKKNMNNSPNIDRYSHSQTDFLEEDKGNLQSNVLRSKNIPFGKIKLNQKRGKYLHTESVQKSFLLETAKKSDSSSSNNNNNNHDNNVVMNFQQYQNRKSEVTRYQNEYPQEIIKILNTHNCYGNENSYDIKQLQQISSSTNQQTLHLMKEQKEDFYNPTNLDKGTIIQHIKDKQSDIQIHKSALPLNNSQIILHIKQNKQDPLLNTHQSYQLQSQYQRQKSMKNSEVEHIRVSKLFQNCDELYGTKDEEEDDDEQECKYNQEKINGINSNVSFSSSQNIKRGPKSRINQSLPSAYHIDNISSTSYFPNNMSQSQEQREQQSFNVNSNEKKAVYKLKKPQAILQLLLKQQRLSKQQQQKSQQSQQEEQQQQSQQWISQQYQFLQHDDILKEDEEYLKQKSFLEQQQSNIKLKKEKVLKKRECK